MLFLAGLEIEFGKLRGRVLKLTALGFAISFAVAVAVYIAGSIISLVDRDERMTHPELRRKIEAVGFGFFIPAFFVTSGMRFDLDALTASASNLLMVPVFLAALLLARGVPAIVYRGALDARQTAIAGLMQATSLPFIVAATAIGRELDLIDAAGSAAMIGAGLLSVLLFPLGGLVLLRHGSAPSTSGDAQPAPLGWSLEPMPGASETTEGIS